MIYLYFSFPINLGKSPFKPSIISFNFLNPFLNLVCSSSLLSSSTAVTFSLALSLYPSISVIFSSSSPSSFSLFDLLSLSLKYLLSSFS